MKYKYSSKGKEREGFNPYEVTIQVMTLKESVRFHDNLARHIPGTSHAFIGEAYKRTREGAKGVVEGGM